MLGDLPPRAACELISDAREARLDAGEIIHRGGRNADLLLLVVEGLTRSYLSSSTGRQATLRYSARGDVVGVPSLIAGRSSVRIQVVTEAHLVYLSGRRLAALASKDARVAWPLLRLLAHQVHAGQELLAQDVFFPIQARVARHLLDLAVRVDGRLIVRATPKEVADSVGSVGPVVSRALKNLRDQKLISGSAGALVLEDPAGLHLVAADSEEA